MGWEGPDKSIWRNIIRQVITFWWSLHHDRPDHHLEQHLGNLDHDQGGAGLNLGNVTREAATSPPSCPAPCHQCQSWQTGVNLCGVDLGGCNVHDGGDLDGDIRDDSCSGTGWGKVNARTPMMGSSREASSTWDFLMKLFLWKLDYDDHDWGGVGLGSNHVHGDNEKRRGWSPWWWWRVQW